MKMLQRAARRANRDDLGMRRRVVGRGDFVPSAADNLALMDNHRPERAARAPLRVMLGECNGFTKPVRSGIAVRWVHGRRGWSGFRAKANSSTILPPIKCSWIIRSSTKGEQE